MKYEDLKLGQVVEVLSLGSGPAVWELGLGKGPEPVSGAGGGGVTAATPSGPPKYPGAIYDTTQQPIRTGHVSVGYKAELRYVCTGRSCPERAPIIAADPPTCYTCGAPMTMCVKPAFSGPAVLHGQPGSVPDLARKLGLHELPPPPNPDPGYTDGGYPDGPGQTVEIDGVVHRVAHQDIQINGLPVVVTRS